MVQLQGDPLWLSSIPFLAEAGAARSTWTEPSARYYLNYGRLKVWIKEVEQHGSLEARKTFLEELGGSFRRVAAFYEAEEVRPGREAQQGQSSHIVTTYM